MALLAVVVLATALLWPAPTVGAQVPPKVDVDRTTVNPGEELVVAFSGWTAAGVTIQTCGNLGRRGSVDCDQLNALTIGIDRRSGNPTLTGFVVTVPPLPCPCVLRASTSTQDSVVMVPIELVGAPVGPLVGDLVDPPLAVRVRAARAVGGVMGKLRASLGGPVPYDVTIEIRNRSLEVLEGIELSGAATRGGSEVATLTIPSPDRPLAPDETWTGVVRSEIPAPNLGAIRWNVTASGVGPPSHAEASATNRPIALFVAMGVLAVDLVVIAWRRLRRHGRERDVDTTDEGDPYGGADQAGHAEGFGGQAPWPAGVGAPAGAAPWWPGTPGAPGAEAVPWWPAAPGGAAPGAEPASWWPGTPGAPGAESASWWPSADGSPAWPQPGGDSQDRWQPPAGGDGAGRADAEGWSPTGELDTVIDATEPVDAGSTQPR
ncbi:MAG: hypothetical protein AB7L84_05990 [Acidimicrobiia bacterium]